MAVPLVIDMTPLFATIPFALGKFSSLPGDLTVRLVCAIVLLALFCWIFVADKRAVCDWPGYVARLRRDADAVYAWTRHMAAVTPATPLSLEQARDLVDAILARRGLPPVHGVEAGSDPDRATTHIAQRRIVLGERCRHPIIVVHEAVHLLVDEVGHGPAFVRTFMAEIADLCYFDRLQMERLVERYDVRRDAATRRSGPPGIGVRAVPPGHNAYPG
jgi:hypothetical protein